MIKKGIFYTSILLVVAFISLGFKTLNSQNTTSGSIVQNNLLSYDYPVENGYSYQRLTIPCKGKYFIGYKEAIAHKESLGRYGKVNSIGYLGKYQFGAQTLKSIGIDSSNDFLERPELQEQAFLVLLSKNKYELKAYIRYFEGKVIDGVKITESGILAAAHLGGSGSVKRFLNTNGLRKCKDGYGTSVRSYLFDFGGYETRGIKAVKNAKID
jgi:hypothetical protein